MVHVRRVRLAAVHQARQVPLTEKVADGRAAGGCCDGVRRRVRWISRQLSPVLVQLYPSSTTRKHQVRHRRPLSTRWSRSERRDWPELVGCLHDERRGCRSSQHGLRIAADDGQRHESTRGGGRRDGCRRSVRERCHERIDAGDCAQRPRHRCAVPVASVDDVAALSVPPTDSTVQLTIAFAIGDPF